MSQDDKFVVSKPNYFYRDSADLKNYDLFGLGHNSQDGGPEESCLVLGLCLCDNRTYIYIIVINVLA